MQTKNYTGGIDVITSQYSFSGQLLRSHIKHEKGGSNPQAYELATKNNYDDLGRITSVQKNLNNSGWKEIASMRYDALGQLKKKVLPLDSVEYDYNIRGWLLGANRAYAKDPGLTGHHFGFDLGYDKQTIASIGSYAQAQFNGNITGSVWKTAGDNQVRKYDFTYDPVNRLTGADFKQYNSGFNKTAGVDFSVSNLTYDANGNILSQVQKGLKGNASDFIDRLKYTYNDYSNRLKNVIDTSNDPQTKLGDFRSSQIYMAQLGTKTAGATDYEYDVNGNLKLDNNKDIQSIIYNHLNLPHTITIKNNKGSIEYVYDAAGIKLEKIVKETGKSDKHTLYLFGIYEDDKLQFLPMEEGRIRPMRNGTDAITSFTYDYFIKDHLGNVRMVLTEEQKQDKYPAATLEGDLANSTSAVFTEKEYYDIKSDYIVNKSSVTGLTDYHNNNGNPPYNNNPYSDTAANSAKLYKLNAESNKTGLGITLKVMAGDQISIYGKSYWFNNGGNYSEKFPVPVSSILDAFLGNPAMIGKGITTAGVSTPSLLGDLEKFRTRTDNVSAPWAYINWIFFDEQFKYAGGGFERVGGNGVVKDHALVNAPSLKAPKNGYVFVYCSNESQHNVYFDNLQVFHNRGPILEETHYYPFGLTMAGISSKAAGSLENKCRFNRGTELNTIFDINLYETKFRGLDPQIGRFCQVDPLADMSFNYSSYIYGNNNPVLLNDPSGLLSDSSSPTLLQTVIVTSKKGVEKAKNWFTGADVGYTGSGWGHGPRRVLARAMGLGNTASNLTELGLHSQFQSKQVRIVGGLLNKIKTEPAMQAFKKNIIQIIKADERFGTVGFSRSGTEGVEFGGNRASAPMSEQFKDPLNPEYAATWQVAGNETTWALRHAAVTYSAVVKSDGTIILDFSISDTFDLRPGPNHTDDYNRVTEIVGPVYHDFFGGNDQMKVTANWQETVK